MVAYGMAAEFLHGRPRKSRRYGAAVIEMTLERIRIKPMGYFIPGRTKASFSKKPGGLIRASPLRVLAKQRTDRLRSQQRGQGRLHIRSIGGRGCAFGHQS